MTINLCSISRFESSTFFNHDLVYSILFEKRRRKFTLLILNDQTMSSWTNSSHLFDSV